MVDKYLITFDNCEYRVEVFLYVYLVRITVNFCISDSDLHLDNDDLHNLHLLI